VILKIISYLEKAHIFTMRDPITRGIFKTGENMALESNLKLMGIFIKEDSLTV
jgi:hypothetical protein